jgi:mycothiol system anti-sigma-R factor
MTCEEALGLISVFLDGELDVADVARLQQHLGECEPCRAAQAAETWLHSVLAAGVLSEEPPASLRQRIGERIGLDAAALTGRRRAGWRRGLVQSVIAVGLSAAIAVLLLAHPGGRGAKDSPLLVDAVAGHRQYSDAVVPHLDVTGDAHRLEQWIRERLGLAVRLPSGARRGEAPVGARVATVAGRLAAQVLYAGQGRRISLFVSRKPSHPLPEEGEHIVDGKEVYLTALGASNLGWWQDGNHLYLAVSSAVGEEDLLALAALCMRVQRAPQDEPSAAGARSPRDASPVPWVVRRGDSPLAAVCSRAERMRA